MPSTKLAGRTAPAATAVSVAMTVPGRSAEMMTGRAAAKAAHARLERLQAKAALARRVRADAIAAGPIVAAKGHVTCAQAIVRSGRLLRPRHCLKCS